MANRRPHTIVVGIGNPDRGDDAAGIMVARLLRDTLAAEGKADLGHSIEVVEHDGELTALLSRFDGVSEAFLVDACASGGPGPAVPRGTVLRFDVSTTPLPQGELGLSTHGFGLAEAIELGRALGQLPSRSIVYAIGGESFEAGAPLSQPVAAAVAEVATRMLTEITAGAG
jgi:hydrogenase maturation protease